MAAPLTTLQGELEVLPLAELVPLLASCDATGTLTVERGARKRTFEIIHGQVVSAASTDPREYLGQFLVDHGLLTGSAAASAFWFQEATHVMLGRLLPMRGLLDEARVREALTMRIRETFLDCYRWMHGAVRFVPAEQLQPKWVEVKVRLTDLDRDARARQKEWHEIAQLFPSTEVKLALTPPETPRQRGALQPGEEEILELARKGSTVAAVLAAFRDGEYAGYRRLMGLVKKGHLAPDRASLTLPSRDTRGLLEAARELLEAGQPAEAWAYAALLVDRGPSKAAARLMKDAELALALKLADSLLNLEGTPRLRVGSRELARLDLPPSELYLLMRLSATRSLREAVRNAPMGELEALKAMERFVENGIIEFVAAGDVGERAPLELLEDAKAG